MARIFYILAATVFWAALGCGPSAAEKRVALVIGNGAYRAPLELANPPEDGRAVADALGRVGFEVIQGYDLKNADMTAKLKEFSRALQGADVGLFFYAGHGMQVAGENYLVPVDAVLKDERDLEFDAVKLDSVMRQLHRDAKVKIVILDACRDNPLAAQLSRSMGTTRSRSLNPMAGMAPVDTQSASGTMIAFATAPGTVASDGEGKHSPFTAALLTHLETPNLDVDLMMKRVRGDVAKSTGDHQQPWTNSSLISEFYMKSGPAVAAAAAPVPPAQPVQTTASIETPPANTASRTLNEAGTVTNELRSQRADKTSEKDLALSGDQMRDINVRLILLGHTTGSTGPALTSGSRKALSAFQSSAGLVPTGYLNRGQYELLKTRSEPQFAAWVQQGRPALAAAAAEADAPAPAAETPRRTSRPERVERAERPAREHSSSGSGNSGSARATGEFLGGVARGLSRGRIGF
jgi:uncharacterized caspase-like protein